MLWLCIVCCVYVRIYFYTCFIWFVGVCCFSIPFPPVFIGSCLNTDASGKVCVCVCVCLCVHVNCHWMVGVFIRCAVFYCHLERQLPYNVHRVCTRNQISHAGTLSFFKWLCAWARLDITVLQEHNIIRNVMATLKMAWQTFLPDTKEILPVSIELSNFKIWTKTSFSSFSFVVKGTFLCSSTHFYPKTDYRWLQIKLKWTFNAWHSSNQWLW